MKIEREEMFRVIYAIPTHGNQLRTGYANNVLPGRKFSWEYVDGIYSAQSDKKAGPLDNLLAGNISVGNS